MANKYNGNLADLRKSKTKILAKRAELRKQLNDTVYFVKRLQLVKRIDKLSLNLDNIEKEILKVQKGMQNSNRWMDGTYNSVDL